MDIIEKIIYLEDEEIDGFINERLLELKNDEEKIVSFNSANYIYDGFFDEKVRINTMSSIADKKRKVTLKFAGFKIDDNNLYKVLIDNCRKINNPYLAVTFAVDEYLGLRDESRSNDDSLAKLSTKRSLLYKALLGKEHAVSIDFISNNKLAFCSEISAVAQNMFKFLNIESDYVTGLKNKQDHSYNIIYPWGREKEAIIFDACRIGKSDTHLYLVNNEKKTKLFSGETVEFLNEDIEDAIYKLFDSTVKITKFDGAKYSINNVAYFENDKYNSLTNTNKYKLVFKKD